jgi:hypothetical protein
VVWVAFKYHLPLLLETIRQKLQHKREGDVDGQRDREDMSEENDGMSAQHRAHTSSELNANMTASTSNANASASEKAQVPDRDVVGC